MFGFFARSKPKTLHEFGQTEYDKLAACKTSCLYALKKNPDILFKSIRCYHDDDVCCESCIRDPFYEDVDFIDMVLKHNTLDEKDFLKIDAYLVRNKRPELDWFKISRKMSLSSDTLKLKAAFVDWEHISQSYMYAKDAVFVRCFHVHIVWDKVCNMTIDPRDAKNLTFDERVLPVSAAIRLHLLDKKDIIDHQVECLPFMKELLSSYHVSTLCQFQDTEDLQVAHFIQGNPHDVIKSCVRQEFVPPVKYLPAMARCLKSVPSYEAYEFFKACKPSEDIIANYFMSNATPSILECVSRVDYVSDEFVRKHEDALNWKYVFASGKRFDEDIIERHLDHSTSEVVSKHQRLDPEFIDKHSDILDWYELCEHQQLPEWLMTKYITKLNWGQVSLYQDLSPSFIKSFWGMLNHVKLKDRRHAMGSPT